MNLDDQRPRRLDFATVRELCLLFRLNQPRASYAALGLLYPGVLGLTGAQVDQRYRAVGNLFDLAADLYKTGCLEAGVDEAKLAELVPPLWPTLLSQAFPSEEEVAEEMGNS
jgi:hypothetical protein